LKQFPAISSFEIYDEFSVGNEVDLIQMKQKITFSTKSRMYPKIKKDVNNEYIVYTNVILKLR